MNNITFKQYRSIDLFLFGLKGVDYPTSNSFSAGLLDEVINKYLIDNKDEYYKIILLHEPDYIDSVINSNINLALSGHSLHGQINIPYLKVNKEDRIDIDNSNL